MFRPYHTLTRRDKIALHCGKQDVGLWTRTSMNDRVKSRQTPELLVVFVIRGNGSSSYLHSASVREFSRCSMHTLWKIKIMSHNEISRGKRKHGALYIICMCRPTFEQ